MFSEAETDPTLSKERYKSMGIRLRTALLKAQYDKSVFTKMPDCKFSCDLETDFVSNENAVAELPQPALK